MSNSTETKPSKLSKWKLQDAAALALGDGWRTSVCMRRQNGSTTSVHTGNGTAYYSGLQTCGSVWACPICATRIAAERRDEIQTALTNSDYKPILVTYTIQHSRRDKLADLLTTIKDALRHTLNGRFRKTFYDEFGVAGYVRSVEIRWNAKTGWHPHVHEMLMVKNAVCNESVKRFLMSRYGEYLSARGYHTNEHTIDVRSETEDGDLVSKYLTKSPIELEITGGTMKEGQSLSHFQLLSEFSTTGDMMYAELFREYVLATAGKKWLTWSRGLKTELIPVEEEKPEDELGEVEDDTAVIVLDRREWNAICKKRLRGQLLAVVSVGLEDIGIWLHRNRIRRLKRTVNND